MKVLLTICLFLIAAGQADAQFAVKHKRLCRVLK